VASLHLARARGAHPPRDSLDLQQLEL
jgi:hypothetical protein